MDALSTYTQCSMFTLAARLFFYAQSGPLNVQIDGFVTHKKQLTSIGSQLCQYLSCLHGKNTPHETLTHSTAKKELFLTKNNDYDGLF